MGNPTFASPMHYDSGQDKPGMRFDLNYSPGVGQVHTLLSIVLTRDADSQYTRFHLTKPDGTDYVSPVIPVGTRTFTQAQINAAGFFVLEDIDGLTAS